jgi:hypothetical protein
MMASMNDSMLINRLCSRMDSNTEDLKGTMRAIQKEVKDNHYEISDRLARAERTIQDFTERDRIAPLNKSLPLDVVVSAGDMSLSTLGSGSGMHVTHDTTDFKWSAGLSEFQLTQLNDILGMDDRLMEYGLDCVYNLR